jgi:phenylpropionate dioxygenase-like ring-hydroxylating dioxygenase large terminal subunit
MNIPVTERNTDGAIVKANYPRNCWWVATTSDKVGREPLALTMLEMPVVLYRKEDGSVVALDDRCPHRWAPLSSGKVVGDDIQCGYHGFTFNAEGSCVRIPSQSQIPSRCRVRAYTVIENAPLIWVWMGDPERIDSKPPQEASWPASPAFRHWHGETLAEGNYMLLKENVLDLTHFGYVHATTFKILDWVDPPTVTTSEDQVMYRQEFIDCTLPPMFAEVTGIGMQRKVNRYNYGAYVSPALNVAALDIEDPDAKPGQRRNFQFRIMHITTPETPTRFRYLWFGGFDIPDLSDELLEKCKTITEIGFAEDKAIIEAVHRRIMHDPRHLDYPEIIVKTDQAAIQARRMLAAQLAEDAD